MLNELQADISKLLAHLEVGEAQGTSAILKRVANYFRLYLKEKCLP